MLIWSMILLFADYPKLTVEEVKKQKKDVYNHAYDKYKKQNNKEAIKFF